MCCILIFLYVDYELNYDRYHENAEEIYRVVMKQPGNVFQGSDMFNATTGLLAPTLKTEYPEVVRATRIGKLGGFFSNKEILINYKENSYLENKFFLVDPEFLMIFTFPLIAGDPETALNEPFTILITQSMVKKYFGDEYPVGKTLNIDKKHDYQVTGILKDIPEDSHFKFDFLTSLATGYSLWGRKNIDRWIGNNWFKTYVQLQNKTDPRELENKLPAFVQKYIGADTNTHFYLQPLTAIHLHGNINFEIEPNGDIRLVYLFSAIGLFILLIACFNYMNLSTARSAIRSKEIGIRKVVGASRSSLIWQFLGESLLFALIALVHAVIFVVLILPVYGNLINKEIGLDFSTSYRIFVYLISITILVGLISGIYPALLLSSWKPVSAIQKKWMGHLKQSSFFRNSLVTIQFIISLVLIISTLVVNNQLFFIKNKKLGFSKEHIITVRLRGDHLRSNYEPLSNRLYQNPSIVDISTSTDLPTTIRINQTAKWEGMTDEIFDVYITYIDYNFIDFFNMKLAAGRNFSKEFSTDIEKTYILNRTAVKALGWENPVGQRFGFDRNNLGIVIGVIEDFHYYPLHLEIEPLAFALINPEKRVRPNFMSIKITTDNISGTLSFIEKTFKEFSPAYPFSYSFLDESVENMYNSERKLGQGFRYFSLIAILIACLGLFGLASFTVEQKIKEIGIRKVLGASMTNVVFLLTKKFMKWVAIANIIAWPVAYYSMNKWLEGFAYRIKLGIWIFVLSAVIAFLIAFLTVGIQALKAATADPVISLRYE